MERSPHDEVDEEPAAVFPPSVVSAFPAGRSGSGDRRHVMSAGTHYPEAHPRRAPRSGTPSRRRWTTSPACSPASSGCSPDRGYNIESLTVSETEHEKHISRITIVTTRHQRRRRADQEPAPAPRAGAPGRRPHRPQGAPRSSASPCAWSRWSARAKHRLEAMRLASAFGARTLDATLTSLCSS